MPVGLRRVLPVVVLLASCHHGDMSGNPNYSEPLVFGYLYRVEYADHTVEYDRDVQVSDSRGLRSVPTVWLGDEQLEAYSYRPTDYRYGDTNPVMVERRYDLAVSHYWGEAFARAVMPGNFSVLKPTSRYILGRDSVLHVEWSASSAAQWYWVEVYAEYDYYDSTGGWDSYSFLLDTLITGEVLDLPSDRVFPGFVAELIEGDGSVVLWAGNGPAVEPGDVGNVRGAGFGFFSGINEPAERYFYVGAPPLARRAPAPGPEVRRRKLELLDRLARSARE